MVKNTPIKQKQYINTKESSMKMVVKLLIFYSLLVISLFADGVTAMVDANEVVEGNPITLQLKAVGEDVEFLDISDINGMPILNSSMQNSSSFVYINGDITNEQSTIKTMQFEPQKSMTIPSYTVKIAGKNYQTKPILISVVQSKAPEMKKDALYDFVLKSDKQKVMMGESIIVELFVSVSDRVQEAQIDQFQDPQMDQFYVKNIGKPKQYHQKGYTVVEKHFLLTPKSEGNFTIKGATAKLGEADLRRRDFFGRYPIQWHNISSNDITISVDPQPIKSDLVGNFELKSSIDTTKVKANKPVNLTVTITGEGGLEDFEFSAYEIDGVSVFGDEATIKSEIVNGTLQSRFTKIFAIVASDDFVIPSRTFSVYNPKTKSLKKLTVPSYTIEVESDKTALVSTVQTQPLATSPSGDTKIATSKTETTTTWWIVLFAFATGMVVMFLILKFIPKMQIKERFYKPDEALKILYPHINQSPQIEAMVRKLYAKKQGDKAVEIDKKELKALIEAIAKH